MLSFMFLTYNSCNLSHFYFLTLKSRKALSLQIEQTNYENKMSSTSIRIIDSKKQKFIFSYGDIKCPLEGTFGLNGPNSPLF